MSKPKPSSVTIEEAVACMVNMDYIPTGFSLLDMTAAFQEEAEVEFENARLDRLTDEQIEVRKIRMESCRARHNLAQLLLESLALEVQHPTNSMITIADDSTSKTRLTLESVSDWAADKLGIGILDPFFTKGEGDKDKAQRKSMSAEGFTDKERTNREASWGDVTIKLWRDFKIGYRIGDGNYQKSSFRDIDLMGKRKNEPNEVGNRLIKYSKGLTFPISLPPKSKECTEICKLRRSLMLLTGITDDPFEKLNPFDGWKPKFTVIYDVFNSDNRAKQRAKRVEIEDDLLYKSGVFTEATQDQNLKFDNEEPDPPTNEDESCVETIGTDHDAPTSDSKVCADMRDDDAAKWLKQYDKN